MSPFLPQDCQGIVLARKCPSTSSDIGFIVTQDPANISGSKIEKSALQLLSTSLINSYALLHQLEGGQADPDYIHLIFIAVFHPLLFHCVLDFW